MATDAAATVVALQLIEEEKDWIVAAAAYNEGRGIDLLGVDLSSNMNPLYEALNVTEYAPKTTSNALKLNRHNSTMVSCVGVILFIFVFNVLFEYGNIRPDKERIDSVLLTVRVPLSQLFSHFRFCLASDEPARKRPKSSPGFADLIKTDKDATLQNLKESANVIIETKQSRTLLNTAFHIRCRRLGTAR
jgi:hypothetical protein